MRANDRRSSPPRTRHGLGDHKRGKLPVILTEIRAKPLSPGQRGHTRREDRPVDTGLFRSVAIDAGLGIARARFGRRGEARRAPWGGGGGWGVRSMVLVWG